MKNIGARYLTVIISFAAFGYIGTTFVCADGYSYLNGILTGLVGVVLVFSLLDIDLKKDTTSKEKAKKIFIRLFIAGVLCAICIFLITNILSLTFMDTDFADDLEAHATVYVFDISFLIVAVLFIVFNKLTAVEK